MDSPLFDTINLDKSFDNDITWEGKLALGDTSVDASLWVTNAEALNPEKLNQIAKHCQNLESLHHLAAQALSNYLQQDSAFIAYHVNSPHLKDMPKLNALVQKGLNGDESNGENNTQFSIQEFVNLLSLKTLSIWIKSNEPSDNTLWLDYALDSNHNDDVADTDEQKLTVQFSLEGHLNEVVWEK